MMDVSGQYQGEQWALIGHGHSQDTSQSALKLWYKPKLRMGKLNFNSDWGAETDVSIKSDWRTDTRPSSTPPSSLPSSLVSDKNELFAHE